LYANSSLPFLGARSQLPVIASVKAQHSMCSPLSRDTTASKFAPLGCAPTYLCLGHLAVPICCLGFLVNFFGDFQRFLWHLSALFVADFCPEEGN
jgi:hypothetical protein